jgi:membrane protease YdiL (CAAX protease family)
VEPVTPAPLPRRWLVAEVWLVFGLSLGASGVRAFEDLVADLTSGVPLSAQAAVMNGSQAPGRPWLDLALQLTGLAFGVVPVLLTWHLLVRSGESLGSIGFDRTRPASDTVRGAALALYLGSHALGVNLTVVPENLPAVWWRDPVLFLSAAQNAVLEEVLVAGYLLHRLEQLRWSDEPALATSAVIRGSYHLYQGLGGFAGNVVMGLLFGRLYQRWGRWAPRFVAHQLNDAVAFLGYAHLAGRVSWLPTP